MQFAVARIAAVLKLRAVLCKVRDYCACFYLLIVLYSGFINLNVFLLEYRLVERLVL